MITVNNLVASKHFFSLYLPNQIFFPFMFQNACGNLKERPRTPAHLYISLKKNNKKLGYVPCTSASAQ